MARPSETGARAVIRRARPVFWTFWIVFVAIMATVLSTVVIWPGEARLTAPLFCDASDLGGSCTPMVVADTAHFGARTDTNYTLYCVGPHGEVADIGFGRPVLTIVLVHLAIVLTLAIIWLIWRGICRNRGMARTGRTRQEPDEFRPLSSA